MLALAAFFYIGQKVSTLSYLAEGYLKFIYTHAARLREIGGGAGGLKRALNIGLPEKEAVAGLLIFASAIACLFLITWATSTRGVEVAYCKVYANCDYHSREGPLEVPGVRLLRKPGSSKTPDYAAGHI